MKHYPPCGTKPYLASFTHHCTDLCVTVNGACAARAAPDPLISPYTTVSHDLPYDANVCAHP